MPLPKSWTRWRVLEAALVIAICAWSIYVRIRVRMDGNWAFAGSDSVGYAKLGHELHDHFRYALAPAPEQLAWVRPPLYPIYLALVFPSGDVFNASWTLLFVTQFAFDLLSGLLAWAMARKLAGPVAGLLALLFTELNPFTPLFSLAMLTETLATVLTMATVAAIFFGVERPRRYWPIAGAFLALSTLLRPDGLILGFGFVPAFFGSTLPRRERLIGAATAILAFTIVFAPWPIRNLVQFGNPHPLGGRIDRYTRPVENYEVYWAWLRSWSRDYEAMTTPTTCFYDNKCDPSLLNDLRKRGAYVDIDDEKTVKQLIFDRYHGGLTPSNSRDFAALAKAHRQAHPLLVEVWLPLTRSYYMWVASFNELLQGRPPWKWRDIRFRQQSISRVQLFAWLIAGLLLAWRRSTRAQGGMLYALLIVRTLVLGYTFYSMPRYSIEVMPVAYVLIAAGIGVVLQSSIARWQQRRQRLASA